MSLTKREKQYIELLRNNTSEEPNVEKGKINYDLNYRLKKKFLKLHEDYWSLVAFFKVYDEIIQKRTTEQTSDSLLKAKSQIPSPETLVNSKCYFCKGTNKKMLEINICVDCKQNLGF